MEIINFFGWLMAGVTIGTVWSVGMLWLVVRLGVVTSMRLMNPDDTRDYLCRVSGFDYEIWDHELEVVNEGR